MAINTGLNPHNYHYSLTHRKKTRHIRQLQSYFPTTTFNNLRLLDTYRQSKYSSSFRQVTMVCSGNQRSSKTRTSQKRHWRHFKTSSRKVNGKDGKPLNCQYPYKIGLILNLNLLLASRLNPYTRPGA